MNRMKRAGFIFQIMLLLPVWYLIGCTNNDKSHSSGSPAKDISADKKPERYTVEALVERSRELDETVWKNEILARKYENVFVQLWDDLRNQKDKFQVLKNFGFNQLIIGKRLEPVDYEWNIRNTRFAKDASHFNQYDSQRWVRLLNEVQRRGFRIEQSEWLLTRFSPPENNHPAYSDVAFQLHLSHVALEHRLILKGTLLIQWMEKADEQGRPLPDIIETLDIQLLEQVGPTVFKLATKVIQEIPRPDDPLLVAPVIVYDVNGDHLPEILLGGSNVILKNKGAFEFEYRYLFDTPVAMFNSGVVADFTGDGIADYLGISNQRYACLIEGNKDGRFPGVPRRCWEERAEVPSAITAGDVDGDGDLDVWFTQYKAPYAGGQMPTPYYDANDGHPSYLFLNDGKGTFSDHTEAAGLAPKRFRRTYSSSLVDLDADDDLDLIVVSDFSGLDIYTNDGNGRFQEATEKFVKGRHAFGMSHSFGDFNKDGKPDLLMIGMDSPIASRIEMMGLRHPDFPIHNQMRSEMVFGNRMYLAGEGKFQETPLNRDVAKTGWTWSGIPLDFDNDGDDDLFFSNGHISGKSVKDFDSYYWTHDVYVEGSRENQILARFLTDDFRPAAYRGLFKSEISWNGYQINEMYMNLDGKSFLECGYLMGVGKQFDGKSAIAADLDMDGRMDLMVVENQRIDTDWGPVPHEVLHIYRNQLRTENHWIGAVLANNRPGGTTIGARITIHGEFGVREKYIITGDGYYSQNPPVAHFGLAKTTRVNKMEVRWFDGKLSRIDRPAIDQYHVIQP